MSNLSKSIIGKIKKEKIQPTPKWVFLLKNSVVWGLFGLSVLFGSIALSIIFFQARSTGWDIYRQLDDGMVEFILLTLPYFWILLMVGFLLLALYHFRHTKIGYRYNVFAIIGLSLIVSLVLGATLYASGFSGKLETLFQKIPHYEKLHIGKQMLWQKPERGRLAGTILDLKGSKILILQDLRKNSWKINISNAQIEGDLTLKKGHRIRMVGEILRVGHFQAEVIGPWRREDFQHFINRREEIKR